MAEETLPSTTSTTSAPPEVTESPPLNPETVSSPVAEQESVAKTETETETEATITTTPAPPPPAEEKEEEEEEQQQQQQTETISESKESSKNTNTNTFIQSAVSFKEESNLLSDLTDSEKKSLEDFKTLVKQALSNNTLLPIESAAKEKNPDEHGESEVVVSIWGIPLLKDDRTDVILLKFLRARDFRVNDAFLMLKNTLNWRVEFGIDKLVEEDLGDDLEKVVFMHGHDREGHPVCYNVYGEFQNKELYGKTFSSEEKRNKFLRWRIQFLEKSIRNLDFGPGGVNTIFQVNDLKNAPGPGKKELRIATRQALHLLQDNYPEFVAKQVFINVPWWYVAFYTMMSPFMTQRTKSKFVFAGPSKTAETLFKYISPEQVPIQYGGLSVDYCDCNPDFTVEDPATVLNLKTATKQFVEIICSEKCAIVWEVRVVGWDVTYSAEFVPSAKESYTVLIQKATKMTSSDDPVISGSFKVSEVGKIVLTVDNPTFKRKKLLYRYKVLPFSE